MKYNLFVLDHTLEIEIIDNKKYEKIDHFSIRKKDVPTINHILNKIDMNINDLEKFVDCHTHKLTNEKLLLLSNAIIEYCGRKEEA